MTEIYKNLYQFSVYIPPMDFTIHQYLLTTAPSILFAAGTAKQAESIIPEIKKLLNRKSLDYIFVSHMESDECGGIFVLQKEFPQVKVICSPLGARELPGFGYTGEIIAASPEKPLTLGDISLKFIEYPAEVHLQNGLLCLEENSGIFYSADLMLRFGNGKGKTLSRSWNDEIAEITAERIPNTEKSEKLKSDLSSISPCFIAVGHGYCIKV